MKKKLSFLFVNVFFAVVTVICINYCIIEAKAFNKPLEKTSTGSVSVYEYVNEDSTADLNENHYIKIKANEKQFTGWYYGTSDDFDEGREGYLPGFFVKKMDDLIIKNNSISFVINVKLDEFVNKPISLRYHNKEELPADEYKKWRVGKIDIQPRSYKGFIESNKIILEVDNEKRIFKKVRGL